MDVSAMVENSQAMSADANHRNEPSSRPTQRTRRDSELIRRLVWIQWAAPLGVLASVLLYELIFEFSFQPTSPAVLRFAGELLIFGVVGPIALWTALGWLRRHLVDELAMVQELNASLKKQVEERTRELQTANRELSQQHRDLEKTNAELQRLDQMKTEFVSLVSHELRAPLANISGALQLVLMSSDEASRLSPSQLEMLTLANEQVERLGRLVKNILDVSRLQAGQMELKPQAFNLRELVENSLSQWARCDPTRRYLAPSVPPQATVWADRDCVEQVLTNLIENAFKYSAEGAEIRLDVQAINDEMLVRVTDEGIGIPPEELERIFDRFHRVERGDARSSYGYGLGLYISRKLVEAMGGKLEVESQVGEGSRFTFSLPLAPPNRQATANPPDQRAAR